MPKICSKCHQEKPLTDYCKDRRSKDGLVRNCLACRRLQNREKYLLNSDREKERARLWFKNNPERAAAAARAYYELNRQAELARGKAWHESNKNRKAETMKKWYAENRQAHDLASKNWAQANPDKVSKTTKNWHAANKDRKTQTDKEWALLNPHVRAASSAKRRAAKLLRTPAWLTPEEIAAIKALYERAKQLEAETGIAHQVDHILPIQGRKVSGLHVLANLQILTATENRQKLNKWVSHD